MSEMTCQECNGTGQVVRELNMPFISRYAVEEMEIECPECGGEGWIESEEL